jgi:hypothetical protein
LLDAAAAVRLSGGCSVRWSRPLPFGRLTEAEQGSRAQLDPSAASRVETQALPFVQL